MSGPAGSPTFCLKILSLSFLHLPGGKSRERRFFRRARSEVFSWASLFCSLLGLSWPLWCSLGPLLASVGLSGALFGSPGALLAPSWLPLGLSWASPWRLLASLGRLLGLSWAALLRSPFLVPLLVHFLSSFESTFGGHFLYLFMPFSGPIF